MRLKAFLLKNNDGIILAQGKGWTLSRSQNGKCFVDIKGQKRKEFSRIEMAKAYLRKMGLAEDIEVENEQIF